MAGIQNESRFSLNYRNHWPGIKNAFVTKNISFESPIKQTASNWGVNIYQDQAGDGQMTVSSVSPVYAYDLKASDQLYLRFGIRPAYVSKTINWNDLVFEDMLSPEGELINISSQDFGESIHYFDLSSGFMLYTERHFMGFAVDHINQPDAGLLGNNGLEKLDARLTFHAGSELSLSQYREVKLLPNILYTKQGTFNKFQLGAYLNASALQLGFWYSSQKSITAVLGYTGKKFRFAYSYDIYNSSYYGAQLNSHEISYAQMVNFNSRARKKRYRKPPCPKF